MENSELGRLTRRVTVVPPNGTDEAPIVVYERKRRQRKGSPLVRGLEKLIRRSMMAQRVYFDSYLQRHAESNTRKKDGWVRDGLYNHARAQRRAVKVLRGLVF